MYENIIFTSETFHNNSPKIPKIYNPKVKKFIRFDMANKFLIKGYESRDYQPYLTSTLTGSARDSSTGASGATPWSKPSHYQSAEW